MLSLSCRIWQSRWENKIYSMETIKIYSSKYILTHVPSHSNLHIFFSASGLANLMSVLLSVPSCGRLLAITRIFWFVTPCFRWITGSEYSHHHWLEGIFTTFGSNHLLLCCLFLCYYFSFDQSLILSQFFSPSQALPTSTSPSALGIVSLYYSFCHFYHSEWLHLFSPLGVLLSFNFDTYLHYLPKRNSRGLEWTAESASYSFPEVVAIGWYKFYRGENC